MQISQNGLNLIKQFEGFRAMPYQDEGGLWTIGYGCRISDPSTYPNGISESAAETLLMQKLMPMEYEINNDLQVTVNQNQFDALCSFVYNVGPTVFQNSTMLRLINANQLADAANQFPRWDHVNGAPDQGLLNRRMKEQALFNS